MGKARAWILVAAATAIAALGVAQTRTGDLLLFNHSPSIQRGLYLRIQGPIERTSIVTLRAVDVAPAAARRRGFDGPGDRFIKRVAALSGDVVCAEGALITVNGQNAAARRARDSSDRTLPSWRGCRTLAADEFLLLGDTADSFDSRYWGPVRRVQIEGVWRRF